MAKFKKVLFFVNGSFPSDEDKKAADGLGQTVGFRNAHHVPEDGALEVCDAVSGVIPERYFVAYPHTGNATLYKTDNDPADVQEDNEGRKTINAGKVVGKEVNGVLSTTDLKQTPASTSPKLQAKAVEKGKGEAPPEAGNGQAGEEVNEGATGSNDVSKDINKPVAGAANTGAGWQTNKIV